MELKTTTNYKQFKRIKGNRQLLPYHVKSLVKSISETNLLPANPIIVNSKMEVIDGEQRLEAAKVLHLPISYIEMPIGTIQDMTYLNSTVRKWNLANYVDLYVTQGIDSYLILADFVDKSGLSPSVSAKLLMSYLANKGSVNQAVKDGTFQVNYLDEAYALLNKVQDIRRFIEGPTWKNREFLKALILFLEQVDYETFLTQLQKYPDKIYARANILGYLREFEDVYNYKSYNKVLVTNRARVAQQTP